MDNRLLTVKGVKKRYAGKIALRGVSMGIECGRVVGLLGPNGSGKTTLIKIIAGLLAPGDGEILGPGGSTGIEAKGKIALLPDAMRLPGWMRVRDLFAYTRDMFADYSQEKADALTRLLELNLDDRINTLSKGMQERAYLAATLAREAELFLLDEPLGGIDPVGKARITDAILSMNLEKSSIIISTHLVKDIERLFDEVYFIRDGEIVFHGECDAMREENGKTVEQAYLEVFGYE